MDRAHQLEDLRRSIAMLEPRAHALDREAAMALIRELQESGERLERLRTGLDHLLADDGPAP